MLETMAGPASLIGMGEGSYIVPNLFAMGAIGPPAPSGGNAKQPDDMCRYDRGRDGAYGLTHSRALHRALVAVPQAGSGSGPARD
jgi:hypothetical protein